MHQRRLLTRSCGAETGLSRNHPDLWQGARGQVTHDPCRVLRRDGLRGRWGGLTGG